MSELTACLWLGRRAETPVTTQSGLGPAAEGGPGVELVWSSGESEKGAHHPGGQLVGVILCHVGWLETFVLKPPRWGSLDGAEGRWTVLRQAQPSYGTRAGPNYRHEETWEAGTS